MNAASEIQRTIHQNRQRIALEYAALGEELNIAKRLRLSVQRKPWAWLSGATLAGITVSFLRPSSLVKMAISKKSKKSNPSTLTIDNEKSSSTFSKIALVTTSLFENPALRTGLMSTARFLIPLVQQSLASHAARKRNQASRDY